jgi:hypothetical protein
MNPQKEHINTYSFSRWFKEIFLPREAPGTNFLVTDGHSSHCSSPELLQFAIEKDEIMYILPSDSTAGLQPPDRSILTHSKYFQNKMLTAGSTAIKIQKR